ncbi:gyrB [Lepeophtheirus salmonis]|uniref:GyrB n=1 Tax=Lepeophtheirus salmonis TaxID=72036 RepID=A0A7R8CQK7_LEPSM|nr:gyrB [Lepeophtheirus salmonis]CAF2896345.1 gyrB [Lepeophtheirus salmonis]
MKFLPDKALKDGLSESYDAVVMLGGRKCAHNLADPATLKLFLEKQLQRVSQSTPNSLSGLQSGHRWSAWSDGFQMNMYLFGDLHPQRYSNTHGPRSPPYRERRIMNSSSNTILLLCRAATHLHNSYFQCQCTPLGWIPPYHYLNT